MQWKRDRLVTLFDPKRLQSWNTDRLEISQGLRDVPGHLKSDAITFSDHGIYSKTALKRSTVGKSLTFISQRTAKNSFPKNQLPLMPWMFFMESMEYGGEKGRGREWVGAGRRRGRRGEYYHTVQVAEGSSKKSSMPDVTIS